MPNPAAIVSFAVALVVAGIILFVPIGKIDEAETYYTSEPLTFETQLVRESQVSKWVFWDATKVEYVVKNTDTIDGTFTINFIFVNEKGTKSSSKKITILAGAQEAITQVSPLNGTSSVSLNVIPSGKLIAHERIVTKEVTAWDRIWDLLWIFK